MENTDNSLISSFDRREGEFFIPSTEPPLDKSETIAAVKALSIRGEPLFRRADRRYVDPELKGQNIALFSFMPSTGATPDSNGIFGFAKIRGVFATEDEAQSVAVSLIQKTDSANKIYWPRVGTPFPVVEPTKSERFSAAVDEVNVQAEAKNEISRFIRKAGDEDQRVMEELKAREQQLRDDVAKPISQEVDNPLDRYIILRRKISDNTYVFTETRTKLKQMKTVILKAFEEAQQLAEEHPHVLSEFKERYEESARLSGVDKANDPMAQMIKQNFEELPDIDSLFQNNRV